MPYSRHQPVAARQHVNFEARHENLSFFFWPVAPVFFCAMCTGNNKFAVLMPILITPMAFQGTEFLFTINNYTDNDLNLVRTAVQRDWGCNYLCFGLEEGAQGTPHIQGYLQVDHRMRASTVNRRIGNRARLQKATRSLEENKKYTSKTRENDPNPNEVWEEYGEARETKSVKTNDYGDLINLLKEGGDVVDVVTQHPELAVKHFANILRIREILSNKKLVPSFFGPFLWQTPPSFGPADVWGRALWLKGPSGIGKTQFACSLIETPLFIRHIDQLRSYNTKEYGGIIFDDMNFLHWPRESQISLLDCEMPTAIHVRYRVVELPAYTKRIFTSNVDIFNMDDLAIKRRVKRINFN